MTCGLCNNDGAELVSGDVSAGVYGVTVMKTLGYMCPHCGPHLICETCGSWDYEQCPEWCYVVQHGVLDLPL